MVKQNDKAIDELANVLDEKLRPIAYDLRTIFNDDKKYDEFRKYTTENLVVSNLNLSTSVVKALKTIGISGMQAAQIMQLISTVDM
jgi:gamma-glutamylcysteine synthetase